MNASAESIKASVKKFFIPSSFDLPEPGSEAPTVFMMKFLEEGHSIQGPNSYNLLFYTIDEFLNYFLKVNN